MNQKQKLNDLEFKTVVASLEKLEEEKSRLQMTQQLADLFKQANPQEVQIIAYLSTGSLFPAYQGKQFNFAEKSMRKVVQQLLQIDAKALLARLKQYGDLGMVVAQEEGYIQQMQCKQTSVIELHQKLVHVLEMTGKGSALEKEQSILHLLQQLDPLSAKHTIRIILGKLRLGFQDMTILDAYSWMLKGDKSLREQLEKCYNICADIGIVGRTLKEFGVERLEEDIYIRVGVPIRPASAQRLASSAEIIERMGGTVAAQPKFDGFRVQVHFSQNTSQNQTAVNTNCANQIHFFSRNLQDMTEMFPELTQCIEAGRIAAKQSFIVEGEAVAYDAKTNLNLSFQETVKRKRIHHVHKTAQQYPVKLFLFDVLFLDGKSLLQETYQVRRQILLSMLNNENQTNSNRNNMNSIIEAIEERVISDAQVLDKYFEDKLSCGLEGLVVKRLDSPYVPGKRNFNWVKLKRIENASAVLQDSVDCAILGYYYGKGRRSKQGIGAVLVGVWNEEEERFQSVAKIGTGLSDVQWSEMRDILEQNKCEGQPNEVESDLKPDVWCKCELTPVVEVVADGITLSPVHTARFGSKGASLALRFPRAVKLRPDKQPFQATTAQELQHLYDMQFQNRHSQSDCDSITEFKKLE